MTGFCISFVFMVYVVFCYLVLVVSTNAIDYVEKMHLRNDLVFVKWDVEPYTLTHYLAGT